MSYYSHRFDSDQVTILVYEQTLWKNKANLVGKLVKASMRRLELRCERAGLMTETFKLNQYQLVN